MKEFFKIRIRNPRLEFRVAICEIDEVCFTPDIPNSVRRDIFSYERIVSADFEKEEFAPRRIKMFLWREF